DEAKELGFETLCERHAKVWEKKWAETDIKIVGDDAAQLAIRMAAYHLNRADHEDDPRVAICAKGYAGEAYCGRYFWDTEINMLPFFIHTNPKGARNLILFRFKTLEGAKRNAAGYGYSGARYAWESSVTGEEECACWQYADHEIHVTADIIYAMMHYVRATGDYEFIDRYGLEIMVETARYWVERVDRDKEGVFHLLGVMGPDEYLPMTKNNAFTNRMVKFALTMTVKYLEQFRERNASGYRELVEKTALTDRMIEHFKEVRDNIRTPYDKETKIILQSDDFEEYADLDFDAIWKDRSRCFGEFISQEKNYRSKALKQADVLEMMMLYPEDFTEEQLADNYDYYEPITTHDSSLSAAVHGILAAQLGRMDEAERFLQKVIDIDMSEAKRGAEEGIHIANCGGIWQMIVYGFAGLKSAMWSDEINLNPHLPSCWESVEIPLKWHGKQYHITVNRNGCKCVEMN
ncbi:MAG: glycoside hydrolase family 65 protein, partial [Acetatifactor sp.]|nr:glycoside hydrolase family 65 protein [Acetatifactor sp.]